MDYKTFRYRRGGLSRFAVRAVLLLGVASCIGLPVPEESIPLYNFHVLDSGRAYRSSQPDAEILRLAINQLGLKTVINLRGPNEGETWYDAERAVCAEMSVTMLDFPMSAKHLPSAETLADVLAALQNADYPILIHCQGGADRTGAVSALYRIVVLGQDKAQALQELTPATMHFRFYAPCMDTLVELFEPTAEWMSWYAANLDNIVCQ
jgi:protein tyrosine/serine phosphatase